MGLEKEVRILFYAQCPKCHSQSTVNIDNLRACEVLISSITHGSFCFATECTNCKVSFITSVGQVPMKSCELCEIRTGCLQTGSSTLQWVHTAKRGALELKF